MHVQSLVSIAQAVFL